MLDEIPSADN